MYVKEEEYEKYNMDIMKIFVFCKDTMELDKIIKEFDYMWGKCVIYNANIEVLDVMEKDRNIEYFFIILVN